MLDGHALAGEGDQVSSGVDELIAEFRKHDWSLSGRASDALAVLGGDVVEPLLVALKDPDGYVRAGVAEALGHLRDPRAFEPLLEALRNSGASPLGHDEDTEARVQAAVALERFGDRRAVPTLLEALAKALVDEHCLAWYVIDALAILGDSSLVPVFSPLLEHNDMDVRKSALAALKRLASP